MCTDQTITSAPRDIKYSMVTISSVTVSWKTPDVIVGDVIYYSLCVRKKQNGSLGRDCQTTIVEPTQLSVLSMASRIILHMGYVSGLKI